MSDRQADRPTALEALRDARPSPSVEQRIVDGAMGRALTPRRRPFAPMLIAAAAAAALVWVFARPEPAPAPVEGAPAVAASDSTTSTPASPASIASAVRHRMSHGKHAVFEVRRPRPDHTEVQLTAGEAQFEVEPLPPGGVFAVQTPHARVEVVGTAFSVNVIDGCSRIAVSEGRVRVRQGSAVRFLNAGDTHRACPAAAAGERWVQSGLAHLVAGRSAEGVADLERYVRAHPRGPLAEEALFHLALAAHRAGDPEVLRQAIDRYLTRFGRGPRADRVRALRPAD